MFVRIGLVLEWGGLGGLGRVWRGREEDDDDDDDDYDFGGDDDDDEDDGIHKGTNKL